MQIRLLPATLVSQMGVLTIRPKHGLNPLDPILLLHVEMMEDTLPFMTYTEGGCHVKLILAKEMMDVRSHENLS